MVKKRISGLYSDLVADVHFSQEKKTAKTCRFNSTITAQSSYAVAVKSKEVLIGSQLTESDRTFFFICGLFRSISRNENTVSFLTAFQRGGSVEDFLNSKDYIPLHSTNMSSVEQEVFLNYTYDTDGLVVQLTNLACLSLPISRIHMDVTRNEVDVHTILKKHVRHGDVQANNWMYKLKQCKGLIIGREMGYEVAVCLVPSRDCNAERQTVASTNTQKNFFRSVKLATELKLKNSSNSDKLRPTLQKNHLSDLTFWDVLVQDLEFVLSTIDAALSETNAPNGLEIRLFCYKFGQKENRNIDLHSIISDINYIVDVSVHSAVTVDASYGDMHCFFSREGLKEVIGVRGQIFPVLTFAEASNFQTNLDGFPLDIKPQLAGISAFPKNLTFLQIYANLPHRRARKCSNYPVSGSIVCTNLLHPSTTKKMQRDAKAFIATSEDNIEKLIGFGTSRIEIVVNLTPNLIFPSTDINPNTFIKEDNVIWLLQEHPIILPFKDLTKISPLRFMEAINSIGRHLINNLNRIFCENVGKGGFKASWSAIQLELALQAFFFGRQLRNESSGVLAVNLGPGAVASNDRSATNFRGFLALEPFNSSATDEYCPPDPAIWTKSSLEQKRIKRAFYFSDCLDGIHGVIGDNLLCSVLADTSYKYSSLAWLHCGLKCNDPPQWGQVIGVVDAQQLAEQLAAQVVGLRYPCVSNRLASMVCEQRLVLKDVIRSGLLYGQYKFFPKFKQYNENRQTKLTWDQKCLLQVVLSQSDNTNIYEKAAEMSGNVLCFLEKENFCFATTLKPLRQMDNLPWILPTIKKLEGQSIAKDLLIKICSLTTALAMLQLGLFVQYKKLYELKIVLANWIDKLVKLQILSACKYEHMSINRLHPTIPVKVPRSLSATTKNRTPQPEPASQEESAADMLPEELPEQIIPPLPTLHVPSNKSYTRWTEVELNFMAGLQGPLREQYNKYVEICRKENVPHRSYKAFQRKRLR